MVNTLDLGLTFKNSRTFLSKAALYRSSPPSIAITHPTSTSVSPTIKSFLTNGAEPKTSRVQAKYSKYFLRQIHRNTSGSSLVFLLRQSSLPHAKPRLQSLLPNLQGTDLSR